MPLVSQNELGGLTEKAWRGLAVDTPVAWGLAKDSNAMVQWLASHDYPFEKDLLDTLSQVRAQPQIAHDNPLDSGVLIAPLHGLIMLDSLMADQLTWKGHIYGINFIIAAMGLLKDATSNARQNDGQGIVLCQDNSILAMWSGAEIRLSKSAYSDGAYELHPLTDHAGDAGHANKGVISSSLSSLSALTSLSSLSSLADSKNDAVTVTQSLWQQLLDYAQNTYVPENEISRNRGAGAGNIDND